MLPRIIRFLLYVLVGVALLFSHAIIQREQASTSSKQASFEIHAKELDSYVQTSQKIHTFAASLSEYEDAGIDTSDSLLVVHTMQLYLANGKFAEAQILASNATLDLANQLIEKKTEAAKAEALRIAEQAALDQAEAKKGTIQGMISGVSGALDSSIVTIQAGTQVISSVTTSTTGIYSFHVDAGLYTLVIEHSGYIKQEHADQTVSAGVTTTNDFTLSKVPTVAATAKPKKTTSPTTAPAPVVSSTAYSRYETKSVATERGTFSIKLLTIDFSSGHVKATADTANDSDCTDGCSVKPLKDFVTQNGGFAGVNGTYFCPTAYPDCGGKTNSFYWKIFNSRVGTMINKDNTLGELDPFLTFDTNNKPHFYNDWLDHSSSSGLTAGISCKPHLVSGGQNVLQDSDMDDKQRTTKSTREALGLLGDTLYVVVASSSTVPDLASIMTSLGVTSSFNIDGGGSTALYYNGAYKAGPGRSLPNALVFTEI